MVNTFEGNRQTLEEDYEFYELTDESSGEPDSGELWEEGLVETGGTYSDNEAFINEFGDKPLDDEAKYLSARYNEKYYKKHEHNVVLDLILQTKRDAGGYDEEFLTAMQSNTTPLTIQILLVDPLSTEPRRLIDGTYRLLASDDMYKLNPVVFFPVCAGGQYTQYIISREYTIDINNNSILVRTDFARQPNYGAIWLLSEDRKTLTYSHTEEGL